MLSQKRRSAYGVAASPLAAGTIWSGSVAVPQKWLGMHAQGYPRSRTGTNTPKPTYRYHIHRAHDYLPTYNAGSFWRHIQRVDSSTFDWSEVDYLMDTLATDGKDVFWQLYGTPTWAAKSAYQSVNDQWGYPGGASPPSDVAYLTAFVSALVTRYKNRGTPIKYLGLWNEPRYLQDNTGYWYGSAAEMASQCRLVRIAAKAADSSIQVVSPSHNNLSSIPTFLTASDGNGGTGKDHIDALCYHPYLLTCPPYLGGSAGTPQTITASINAYKTAAGLSSDFPLFADELALASALTDPNLGRHPDVRMVQWLKRTSAMMLAQGWKMLNYYAHDEIYIGTPAESAVVSRGLDELCAALTGQTITRIDILTDGQYRVYGPGGLLMQA